MEAKITIIGQNDLWDVSLHAVLNFHLYNWRKQQVKDYKPECNSHNTLHVYLKRIQVSACGILQVKMLGSDIRVV